MSDLKAKWIEAGPAVPSASGKTKCWLIYAKQGRALLGSVHWFARWRRYAFYPDAGTVFEQDCLRDIATFCEERTKLHREARKIA